MANICCTGVTECNSIVTIGYLKSFIGDNIHSSINDSVLYVNNADDTYCPTYSELTGGTIIQNHANGITPNNDVDGIVVGGSYSSNQCVKKEDLSMIYTRFDSLTISPNKSFISECGGNLQLSYLHYYTRYNKTHSNNCESTDITETIVLDNDHSNITWNPPMHGSVNSSTLIYSIGKNGSVSSNARTDYVSANSTFRGAIKYSNIIEIEQSGLAGDYSVYVSSGSEVYSYDSYHIYPRLFDCNGGSWTGTGYYTEHTWDVYKWKDSCEAVYDDITTIKNHKYMERSEQYGSGTVSSIDCRTIPQGETIHNVETYSYHGINDTIEQTCSSCGGCNDYTAYTYQDVTVPCSELSATVNYTYTAYTAHINEQTGECTYTPGPSQSGSYVVSWNCNTNNPTPDPHVTLTNYPCCATGTVVTFADVRIPCTSVASSSTNVSYTSVTTNPDGTTTETTGSATKNIPSAACNSNSSEVIIQAGNTGTTVANANPNVIQEEGPCCCTPSTSYTFDDVTVPCTSAASQSVSVGYTLVTINANCEESTSRGTATKTIPSVSCNCTNSNREIQAQVIGTTTGDSQPRVIQLTGDTCCPSAYTYNDITLPCNSADSQTIEATYTITTLGEDCTTISSSNTITIEAIECNTGDTKTIQVGSSASTLAEASPTIYQEGGECDCDYTACTLKTGSTDDGSSVISLARTGETLTFDVSNCGNVDDCVELLETRQGQYSGSYIQKFKVINTRINSSNYQFTIFSSQRNIAYIDIDDFHTTYTGSTFQVYIDLINIGSFSYTMEFKESRIGGTTICSKSVEYNG